MPVSAIILCPTPLSAYALLRRYPMLNSAITLCPRPVPANAHLWYTLCSTPLSPYVQYLPMHAVTW
eukprot:1865673-Rhodomonas_salina.1